MSRRRAQLVVAALAIALVAWGKTAAAADAPAELDIGWVNVGRRLQ